MGGGGDGGLEGEIIGVRIEKKKMTEGTSDT